MVHLGGSGRRRGVAVAAILVALCVATPELAPVAGASTVRPASSVEMSAARPATHVVLVARRRRRRSHAAIRRARIRRYLKGHPAYLARKLKAHPAVVARALRKKGIPAKTPRQARARIKHTKKRRAYARAVAKRKKRPARARRARATAAKKRRGAKAKKAAKKSTSHPLKLVDWAEIGLLGLSPFAAVALLLFITDFRRRPRAPSRAKRRRSLVITPLNKH